MLLKSSPDTWGDAPLPGEQVVLDGNVEAQGHSFFSLGGLSISEDGRWLAFSTDVVGNERYTVPPDTTFDKVSLDQSAPGRYRNYMTLAVTPTKCIATCHLEDGSTVDRVVLTKDTLAR